MYVENGTIFYMVQGMVLAINCSYLYLVQVPDTSKQGAMSRSGYSHLTLYECTLYKYYSNYVFITRYLLYS